MFHRARLTLTGWYVLILMIVSLAFSGVVYLGASREIARFSGLQRQRLIQEMRQGELQLLPQPLRRSLLERDQQLETEAVSRVRTLLVVINSGILVTSAILAYWLAGKTLRPIQVMLKEQEQFISDASHELRTPITVLRTTLEVGLRQARLPAAEARTLLKESLEEVIQLQALTGSLLQLQAGAASPDGTPQQLTLSPVIDTVLKKLKPLAAAKKITLTAEHTSGASVVGSTKQLQEILTILLDNAIKYSGENTQIRVTTQLSKKNVIVAVQDTGIGIAPKDLPHIFDRLYRADVARSKEHVAGFGLGLSIAQSLAEAHHGKITVKSTVGTGSTFTLTLPRVASVR